jgi:hypothetical protein
MRPKTHYRNMDKAKAEEIRRKYFAREAKQAELAKQYGIRQHTVSRIVSGLVWALLSMPVYADFQMVIVIQKNDDKAFLAVDKPWKLEHQCLMVFHQYKLGAAKKAITEKMVGGGCLDCAEFPEFCGSGI